MTHLPDVNDAIKLAYEKHYQEVDQAGLPYITHPMRVMLSVKAKGYDEDHQIVAILHDVVENSDVTLQDLRDAGYKDRVVNALALLTKTKGEPNVVYYQRIRGDEDGLALVVKLADIEDNTDPNRLVLLDLDTRARLTDKYTVAVKALTE